MARLVKVNIEELLKSCGANEACLDGEVTYERFHELSHYLTQWQLLAPNLNISQDEVEAIESEHQKAVMRRITFLDTWKQRMSFKATFRALVDALLSIGRAEDARGVCKTLTDINTIAVSSTPSAIQPTFTTTPSTHSQLPALGIPTVAAPPTPATTTSTPPTPQPNLELNPCPTSVRNTSPPPTTTAPSLPAPTIPPSITSLEASMCRLEKRFNHLVQSTENSFHKNGVTLLQIQDSIKFIPITLKLQLGDCFRRQVSSFLEAKNIKQLFFELSYFWDYLNPGLLRFLVREFGSLDDNRSMMMYMHELQHFRDSVKIGDFIKASHADTNIHHFIYTKIAMVMDRGWANKTLQDAEQFKLEICNESHLPQSFTTRMCVQRSSVAIVFYFPHCIEINTEKLKPVLKWKQVAKVYVENICVIDWTKEMPEKRLLEFEDNLKCSICLDTYTDPKILECFHSFCHKCLVKLEMRDQQGQPILTCPICRHITPVPTSGVASLQPALHIHPFLEIIGKQKEAPADSSPVKNEECVKRSVQKLDEEKIKPHRSHKQLDNVLLKSEIETQLASIKKIVATIDDPSFVTRGLSGEPVRLSVEQDFAWICAALQPHSDRWKLIALGLGFIVPDISADISKDTYLQAMLFKWLQYAPDKGTKHNPTLSSLQKALREANLESVAYQLHVAERCKELLEPAEQKLREAVAMLTDPSTKEKLLPGTRLSAKDVNWIYNILRPHSYQWIKIGQELGFTEHEMSRIEDSALYQTDRCLQSTLSWWLLQVTGHAEGKMDTTLGSLLKAINKAGIILSGQEVICN